MKPNPTHRRAARSVLGDPFLPPPASFEEAWDENDAGSGAGVGAGFEGQDEGLRVDRERTGREGEVVYLPPVDLPAYDDEGRRMAAMPGDASGAVPSWAPSAEEADEAARAEVELVASLLPAERLADDGWAAVIGGIESATQGTSAVVKGFKTLSKGLSEHEASLLLDPRFQEFVRWTALLDVDRKEEGLPRTVGEWSKDYRVGVHTLGRWRNTEAFRRLSEALLAAWMKGSRPRLYRALLRSAETPGKAGAPDRRTVLELMGELKRRIEHSGAVAHQHTGNVAHEHTGAVVFGAGQQHQTEAALTQIALANLRRSYPDLPEAQLRMLLDASAAHAAARIGGVMPEDETVPVAPAGGTVFRSPASAALPPVEEARVLPPPAAQDAADADAAEGQGGAP